MDPKIWGPSGWLFLHTITFNYPTNPTEEDKKNYKLFFESLKNVIPCPICSEHYKENLKKIPIKLNSKDENNPINTDSNPPSMESLTI